VQWQLYMRGEVKSGVATNSHAASRLGVGREEGELARGIVVLGPWGSGLEDLAVVLAGMCGGGVLTPGPESPDRVVPLDRLNEDLLREGGGSWDSPPTTSPVELARALVDRRPEAGTTFLQALGSPHGYPTDRGAAQWVWADPRLTLLLPFWGDVLGIPPLVVWVVRDPAEVLSQLVTAHGIDATTAATVWERYQRAALSSSQGLDMLLLRHDELVDGRADTLARIGTFLGCHGMRYDGEVPPAMADGAQRGNGRDRQGEDAESSDPMAQLTERRRRDLQILHRVLRRLSEGGDDPASVVEATIAYYDADYYRTYESDSGLPYTRDEPAWQRFFSAVATAIVTSLHPSKVLDVGCAIGLLVEALRERGVDATGIDVSSWAVKQVPVALRPYCSVGSVVDPFPDKYDLVTCIEVLEHLPPAAAPLAVANLCAHTDAVLVSSTPDDVVEPSHLNVEPPDYWARLFAEEGFTRDFRFDASLISPQAALFRRNAASLAEVVGGYEQLLRSSTIETDRTRHHLEEMTEARDTAIGQRDDAIAEHDTLAARLNALGAEHERLAQQAAELAQRRAAEAVAAERHVQQLERDHARLVNDLVRAKDEAARLQAELDATRATKVFRYSSGLRSAYGRLRRVRRASLTEPFESPAQEAPAGDRSYDKWVEFYDTLDAAEMAALGRRVELLERHPLVSVILPVYNTPEPLLRRAIESVREQIYPTWELCIADDMSTDPSVAAVLAEYEALDSRIHIARRTTNGHIAAASNTAIGLASGTWVALMDHDDELRPHTLAHVVLALAGRPDAGMAYTDEDKMDVEGRRQLPYFKPDFDPLLLLGQNFLGHLVLYRRDLVEQVGGYREGYEGSQDWDLSLRIAELLSDDQVVHVPRVLYHWRIHPGSTAAGISAKPYARDAGHRAVVEHLAREGLAGDVVTNPATGWHRVRWHLPDPVPKVSIVVPTRDGHLLARCLESIYRQTTYPDYEILVVDNGSAGRDVLNLLRSHEHLVRVVRDERPFNYSALNNAAVAKAEGEIVCLLNDDCEVAGSEWLDELVGQVLQPGVGIAGAKLLYPDRRIQHAGVILGWDGVAGHVHRLSDRMASGHGGRLHLPQTLSAVTAACMVIRREAWAAVGGLDEEHLPIAFNDVDFCLRVREAGWRVVWSPYAELIHHESATRGEDTGPRAEGFARECAYMKERWGRTLRCDPAYNPNLTLQSGGLDLAFPPRLDCADSNVS
jgi:GT2 family glycosyltransferase/2-polyprenyl-3-methyl-5-hydroxy-6-metoxy-1,4-benzoquinol methylase